MSTVTKSSKPKFSVKYILVIFLILVIAGGAFWGYQQYSDLKEENKKLSNPQESAKVETDKIKSEVSNIIELPTDEEPTIATVSDTSKLSNQAFFKNAKNGDKLLMYSKAKKAVLYRPDTKKIIEVAPINIGDDTKKSTTTTQQPAAENTQPSQSEVTAPATDPTAQQPGLTP